MLLNTEEIKLYFPTSLKKQFNAYEIELTLKKNISINILIRKKDDLYYYESSFSEKNLQNKLNTNDTINNIYKDIYSLIDDNKIKINENNNNLLLSLLMKDSYIELIIQISIKNLLSQINDKLNQLKCNNNNNNNNNNIKYLIIIISFSFIMILNIILFSLVINLINKLKKITIK